MNEIKNKILKPNQMFALDSVASIYPEATAHIETNGNCVVLLLYTDNGGAVIIEAGDSVFAGAPLNLDLQPAVYYAVQLETGRFMHQNGEHKGKILISTDIDDLTCNCFQVN